MAPRNLIPDNLDGTIRVLHISDCHLYADSRRDLLGVNTMDSFRSTLLDIIAQNREYDFIAVTGDLSQDYSVASYEHFAREIAILKKPVFFLPGNHDDGPLMYKIFGNLGINVEKNVITPYWQFIFLNSEVYAVPHGWIEKRQLDYVRFCAHRSPDKYIVVLVHHMPQLVNSAWLDTQTMHNKEEFNACMRTIPNLKLVLTGHVHQEFEHEEYGIKYLATPSTSIQFAPLSANFSLDDIGPGWRYLTFYPDGTFESEVCRLKNNIFTPNFDSGGY